MNRRWIAIEEVASRLGISEPTARKLLRSGGIPGRVEHCGMTRIEREKYEKWEKGSDQRKSRKLDSRAESSVEEARATEANATPQRSEGR